MEKVYFAKTKEDAIIPHKREEDAGYDIFACFDEEYFFLHPHETKLIPTGIASAFSSNYYFQIFDRGGTGAKGITCFAGVIDSGFRGEWFIAWHNGNNSPVIITKDKDNSRWTGIDPGTVYYPYTKAIAQAILLPVPAVTTKEISYDELKRFTSDRGEKMLGSTDQKISQEKDTPKEEENPFVVHYDKIIVDLTKAHTNIENHKGVFVSFIEGADLSELGLIMKKNLTGLKSNINIEGNSNICNVDIHYPVTDVDLNEKTVTFKGEKIYGIFPTTCTLKYNPEIMQLNFIN